MPSDRKPPVHLDLLRIRMPVTAVVSIGHRLSGLVLVLCIPVLVYLLQRSLEGPQSYAGLAGLWARPAVKALAALVLLSVAHHVLAGVRLLLIDVHIGLSRAAARRSAWAVLAGAVFALVCGAVGMLLT